MSFQLFHADKKLNVFAPGASGIEMISSMRLDSRKDIQSVNLFGQFCDQIIKPMSYPFQRKIKDWRINPTPPPPPTNKNNKKSNKNRDREWPVGRRLHCNQMTRWIFTSISFPLSSFDRFWLDFHENGRRNLLEEYVILISNQLLFTSETKVRQKFFSFHVIFRSLGVNQTAQWIVSNIWGLGGVDQTPQWIVSNIGTGGCRS